MKSRKFPERKKSVFVQYTAYYESQGMMSGTGKSVSIIYADSDKKAISQAKKIFKDGNKSIWSAVKILVLTKEYTDKSIEMLRLKRKKKWSIVKL